MADNLEMERLRAFMETTTMHVQDGLQAGMNPANISTGLLLYAIALYVRDHGTTAAIQGLRIQADKLEANLG